MKRRKASVETNSASDQFQVQILAAVKRLQAEKKQALKQRAQAIDSQKQMSANIVKREAERDQAMEEANARLAEAEARQAAALAAVRADHTRVVEEGIARHREAVEDVRREEQQQAKQGHNSFDIVNDNTPSREPTQILKVLQKKRLPIQIQCK